MRLKPMGLVRRLWYLITLSTHMQYLPRRACKRRRAESALWWSVPSPYSVLQVFVVTWLIRPRH